MADPEGPAEFCAGREDQKPATLEGRQYGVSHRETANTYETRMRLVLPVGRGMRSVNRQQGLPTPALRRPMLIVIEGGRHAASPTSSA